MLYPYQTTLNFLVHMVSGIFRMFYKGLTNFNFLFVSYFTRETNTKQLLTITHHFQELDSNSFIAVAPWSPLSGHIYKVAMDQRDRPDHQQQRLKQSPWCSTSPRVTKVWERKFSVRRGAAIFVRNRYILCIQMYFPCSNVWQHWIYGIPYSSLRSYT